MELVARCGMRTAPLSGGAGAAVGEGVLPRRPTTWKRLRPAKGRVMPRAASAGSKGSFVGCLTVIAVFGGGAAVAQPKVGQGQPFAAPAGAPAQPSTTAACCAVYALGPTQQIEIYADLS